MGNRRDEGFGSGYGSSSHDPSAQWDGPGNMRGGAGREPRRVRRFQSDEEMGGVDNAMGRGGFIDDRFSFAESQFGQGRFGQGQYGQGQFGQGQFGQGQFGQGQYGQGPWNPREREFNPYAAGEHRDDFRRFSMRDDRDFGDHGPFGREMPFGGSFSPRRPWAGMRDHDWSPVGDRWPVEGRVGNHDWGFDRFDGTRWGRGMNAMDMGGYGEDDRGPFYGRGPKGYKRSDDRIREELCEMISRQGFMDASDVEIIVESGVVRLVGTVPHRQDKRTLEQFAERVHGVDEVRNELRKRDRDEPFSSRHDRHAAQPHNGGKTARS